MEPEIITPAPTRNKKKFLLVAVAIIVLAITGVAYWYFFMQKNTSMPATEVIVDVPAVKSPEQIEKERILAELAQAIPKDTTTQAEKTQILKNLTKSIPKVSLSAEEKAKILQALASSTPQ